MADEPAAHCFTTPTQAADELNVKPNQIHALIKTSESRALQVGGKGCHAGRTRRHFPRTNRFEFKQEKSRREAGY
jgi:hypothetical protein